MKYCYNFNEFEIINKINNAKTLNELKEIETCINSNLNESFVRKIKDFFKKKVQQVKQFFTDSDNLLTYAVTGVDPDDVKEIVPTEKKEQILLVYNEPKGTIINKYLIYNGTDATNHMFDFNSVFYSYSLGNKFKSNLKNTDTIKVSKYENSFTNYTTEYVMVIYSLLDDLEVDRELYGYGAIEDLTPHIIIYLKNLKENYQDRLYDYLESLLQQPPDYDEKIITTFNKKYINIALKAIELDNKLKS